MNLTREEATSLVGSTSSESAYHSLNQNQRILGFSSCLFIGAIVQCYAIWKIVGIFVHPLTFSIICAIGVIVHLFGTTFLISPKKQIKTAKDRERLPALILYTLMIAATIISGLIFISPLMTTGFAVLQVCAYIWYCFCKSPYAKTYLQKAIQPQPRNEQQLTSV